MQEKEPIVRILQWVTVAMLLILASMQLYTSSNMRRHDDYIDSLQSKGAYAEAEIHGLKIQVNDLKMKVELQKELLQKDGEIIKFIKETISDSAKANSGEK